MYCQAKSADYMLDGDFCSLLKCAVLCGENVNDTLALFT